MARRISTSQFRSAMNRLQQNLRREEQKIKQHVRRLESEHRRAVNNYNRQARAYNSAVKQAVAKYNQQVRARNAAVSRDWQTIRRQLAILKARPASQHYTVVRESTYALHSKYEQLEHQLAEGWQANPEIAALVEHESNNSLNVLNTLLAGEGEAVLEVADEDNGVAEFLDGFSEDLRDRWQGAVFALNPLNPDAARHFCTSVREIFREIIDETAPDEAVEETDPGCERTRDGIPTRRAKITYLLRQKGMMSEMLSDFVESDIDNIVDLFGVFNRGTHGPAGTHAFAALKAIKKRVQDGIMFLASIAI